MATPGEPVEIAACGVRKFGRTSQNIRFAGKTKFTHPTRFCDPLTTAVERVLALARD